MKSLKGNDDSPTLVAGSNDGILTYITYDPQVTVSSCNKQDLGIFLGCCQDKHWVSCWGNVLTRFSAVFWWGSRWDALRPKTHVTSMHWSDDGRLQSLKNTSDGLLSSLVCNLLTQHLCPLQSGEKPIDSTHIDSKNLHRHRPWVMSRWWELQFLDWSLVHPLSASFSSFPQPTDCSNLPYPHHT